MKQNCLKKAFCAIAFLLCLTPLAVFLIAGPSAAGANERLPAKPTAVRAGRVNWEVLSDTADYFAGRFGLRQELITANAAVQATVFHESAAEDVVLGADGWLYYADTLADYTGSGAMSERQLWCAARNLALMQEYAASRGARFVFLCAPNKNTIYPQYMPSSYARAAGDSNLDRLERELTAQNVLFCDVREALAKADELTYYATDSHWNGYGSALAHDALLRTLGAESNLSGEEFSLQAHSGDLYEMLYPASARQENGLSLSRARTFRYAGEVRGADDQSIHTFSGEAGAVLVFRDSFGNALHEDLAESWGEALFSRAMPYDFSLMDKLLPDTVIVELVERNLNWLSTRAPLIPAPERENVALAAAQSGGSVQIETDDTVWDGMVCYRGTFTDVAPETEAAVYACLDGAWYEACPTEDGFSLIAPAAQTITIQLVCDDTAYSVAVN